MGIRHLMHRSSTFEPLHMTQSFSLAFAVRYWLKMTCSLNCDILSQFMASVSRNTFFWVLGAPNPKVNTNRQNISTDGQTDRGTVQLPSTVTSCQDTLSLKKLNLLYPHEELCSNCYAGILGSQLIHLSCLTA